MVYSFTTSPMMIQTELALFWQIQTAATLLISS